MHNADYEYERNRYDNKTKNDGIKTSHRLLPSRINEVISTAKWAVQTSDLPPRQYAKLKRQRFLEIGSGLSETRTREALE